jgi:4-amino-4-deoxy-L-arabinose transferase-like glycosyltransferase
VIPPPDPTLDRFWAPERRAWPTALAAGLGALALYAATASPYVFTADPAEFQTLARTGGIAHAGYPTFIALLQAAGRLPLGSLALRANLLTACFGALAIALLAYVAHRSTGNRWAALVAAAAFAMGITTWNESTLAGVHAPTLAVDAALLLLALRYRFRPSLGLAAAAGGLFGLGLTGHLTVLGLAPPLLVAFVSGLRSVARPARHIVVAVLALVAGLAPFALLIAQDRPEQPMNYLSDTLEPGDASFAVERPDFGQRLERFQWLLSGSQYMGNSQRDLRTLVLRVTHVVAVVTLNDLPFVTWILAVAGFVGLLRGGGALAGMLGPWFAAGVVLAGLGGTEHTLHYFFQPCTWILAVGLAGALGRIAARRRSLAITLAAIVLVMPLVRLQIADPPGPFARMPKLARVWSLAPREWSPLHRDLRYDAYGRGVMRRLPPRAVVLGARWEESTTLRYFVYGEPLRPDVSVLYAGLESPRFSRLRAEAERAGRPVYMTRLPSREALAGAHARRVWDSGWRELWVVTAEDPSGAASPSATGSR